MESLFELAEPRKNVHSCTGVGCRFCEYVNGTQAKSRGMREVVKDPEYTLRATEWRRSLEFGRIITADDLIEAHGLPMGSSNQVGALFNTWARLGAIRLAGVTQSRRDSNHARKVTLWEVV